MLLSCYVLRDHQGRLPQPSRVLIEVCALPGLQLDQASNNQIHTEPWGRAIEGLPFYSAAAQAAFFTLAVGGLSFPCLDGSPGLRAVLRQD